MFKNIQEKLIKPESQYNLDLKKRIINYNNEKYFVVKDVNNINILIKPIFVNNTNMLLNKVFNGLCMNVIELQHNFKLVDKDVIIKFINKNEFEKYGVKYFYNYQILNKISNPPLDLMETLCVTDCYEAQPYFTMLIKEFENINEKNFHIYNVDKKMFDILSNVCTKEEQMTILKEIIKKDQNYLVESAVRGSFMKLAIKSENEIIRF